VFSLERDNRRGWTVAHTVTRYLDADAFIPLWHSLSPTLRNQLALSKTHSGEIFAHLVMRHCVHASFFFWESLSDPTKNKLIDISDKKNRTLIGRLEKGAKTRQK